MEEFQVKILASDHPFYEGKCYSLVIPTLRGMYGIHAHHSNMITAIIPGTLQYQIVPGAPLEAMANAVRRLSTPSVSGCSMGSWAPVSTTGIGSPGSIKESTEAV